MPGRRILIIDGDGASRNFLGTTLGREGFEVLLAASGKEGLISAWRDRPDLILVDPVLADLPGEELAKRLRSDARTAKVPLLGLSSDTTPSRREECLQAGFDECLAKGPQVIPTLVDRLGKLIGRAAAGKEGGLLFAFLSAKGGTGTSSLCANLGMNIAEEFPQTRVVVADLVLPIGSIAGIVGVEGGQDLVSIAHMPTALITPEFLYTALPQPEAWCFHLLTGSPDPDRANELDVGRIGQMVSMLKLAYDFVLLDLGRSLSRISLPLIEHADLIAMIVANDMSTVMLSKTVWDYLRSKGVQAGAVYVILNRAVGLEGLSKPQAEEIIGLPIKSGMPYLGANVSLANNQHQPYCVKFPADTASIVLKDTARQMADLARHLRAG